ncbi:S15/NS1 RNA-binding domain-containing protein [Schizopora paradoxa]|uniref:S15/NS1 RNA-binding domain-containing protein n=1 Tax=Schizopora paradoxa TaxID=27342 RepID=A0A0H2S890_9AGAM|nr:S15/NS1 RNA-binding domain-containing protein [Schizopora paradoxa]
MSILAVGRSFTSPVASSSRHVLQGVASLHSSSVQRAESMKARAARLTRRGNIERKEERQKAALGNRPHVVLGTRPGDESKWADCTLAKTVLTREAIAGTTSEGIKGDIGEVKVPKFFSYGLDAERAKNSEFFFEHLPSAAVEDTTPDLLQERLVKAGGDVQQLYEWDRNMLQKLQKTELQKATQLARVVDLRNANAKGITVENKRRIIAAFSPSPEEPSSGYPEVQVALLTLKIRSVWEHLIRCKKDLTSRRALRRLVHQRAKMLKYIRSKDRDRYDSILERLALEPGSVEGELVL